nr:hypothetical protein [Tanacetum cinerariifolium]
KISGWPEEDEKVAESVLCRVEVVDHFDVQAFGSADVFEDVPVCAGGSSNHVSLSNKISGISTHAHWNSVTKKQATFSETV